MKLNPPFEISSRLMPAVRIGGATLSLALGHRNIEGRTVYEVWIDLPDGTEHAITDLRSGVGSGDVQDGMSALLSFLGAAAESYPDGENADLFPSAVCQWATENADEISMMACEIDENKNLVED